MVSGAVLPFCSFQLVPLGMIFLGREMAAQQAAQLVLVMVCSSLTYMSLSDDLSGNADSP